MPIRRFLNAHAFDPEAIEAMSIAFQGICVDMHVSENDRMAEVVAKRIIELTAKGATRDPTELRAAVIASFKRGE
jgi:hypothetical protein